MDVCPWDPSKPSAFAVGMLREKKRMRARAEADGAAEEAARQKNRAAVAEIERAAAEAERAQLIVDAVPA